MGVVKRDSRLSMASKTGILLVLLGLPAGTWAQTCEDFGVVDAPPCNADANCTASQGCACSGDEPDIPLEDRPMIFDEGGPFEESTMKPTVPRSVPTKLEPGSILTSTNHGTSAPP